jgi:hypothetical protein
VDSQRDFDIVAKMEGDPPPVMPGTDRTPHGRDAHAAGRAIQAGVHRETREMDIYALVLARPDGKLGPALKPTTQDCAAMMAAARGGPPPGPPPGRTVRVCWHARAAGTSRRGRDADGPAREQPLRTSAAYRRRSHRAQRCVGLRAHLRARAAAEPAAGVEFPAADPNAPSLFTAMQEQLGLKLQSTKGPVEVLVVDRIDQPMPD